ncbi:MAG: GNAT family N-acetyltransferase [Candidatus Woesearchaeota archaeon]|jgi:ribosomal protein S18 acetylase RimI-like enzyme
MEKYNITENISEIIINEHKFILRLARNDDFEFIFNLLKENMLESFKRHWGTWNENSFKETHRKENIRIIECDDEQKKLSVGYVDFKFKKDCGYINDIQISKEFQSKGIGTYIMKLVEQETLNHELNIIRLKVFKDNKVVKLYERLGYKPIFEDNTSMIMEKVL